MLYACDVVRMRCCTCVMNTINMHYIYFINMYLIKTGYGRGPIQIPKSVLNREVRTVLEAHCLRPIYKHTFHSAPQ